MAIDPLALRGAPLFSSVSIPAYKRAAQVPAAVGTFAAQQKKNSVLISNASPLALQALELEAQAQQAELYRIDLAQVTHKYIGETEKNLDSVFGEGSASGATSLLDETDPIFSERTEARESNDRYRDPPP